MGEHADSISSLASWASYYLGIGLIIGDAISFLDNHAGAFGGIMLVVTYLTNCAFKFYDRRNK
jgi:hypothetical protein